MKQNFRKLLNEITEKPVNKPQESLEKAYKAWTKNETVPQIDDLLILGLKMGHFLSPES